MSLSGKGCEKCNGKGRVPFDDDAPGSMMRPCGACSEPWGPRWLDARTVYTGVAGHTITEGTGGRDAVVTEEYASSEDAWTALAGELKARGGRS